MLEQRQAQQLLRSFGRTVGAQKDYSVYIISSEEELERYYGRRCTKKRKLYKRHDPNAICSCIID